jgi:hypothetical protein
MNGWLLGAFLARKKYGTALGMLVQSYLLNPLWFTNPSLRELHRMKLRVWYGNLTGTLPGKVPVESYRYAGTAPFAFIPPPPRPRPRPGAA